MNVEIEHQRYGVDLIKIDNEETKIVFTNYGARIVSWKYHDNNIVLGMLLKRMNFILIIHLDLGRLLDDMVVVFQMRLLI